MTDLDRELEREKQNRKRTAADNRRDFPMCAKFIDSMTEEFGKVKVDYLTEGGKSLGKKTMGLVQAMPEYVRVK